MKLTKRDTILFVSSNVITESQTFPKIKHQVALKRKLYSCRPLHPSIFFLLAIQLSGCKQNVTTPIIYCSRT